MIHRKNAFEALKSIHHTTKLIAVPFKFASVYREMLYQRSWMFVFIEFSHLWLLYIMLFISYGIFFTVQTFIYICMVNQWIIRRREWYGCFIITLYKVPYRLRICWLLLRERTLCNSISFICIRKNNKKDILCASQWIICWLNQTKYVTLSIC